MNNIFNYDSYLYLWKVYLIFTACECFLDRPRCVLSLNVLIVKIVAVISVLIEQLRIFNVILKDHRYRISCLGIDMLINPLQKDPWNSIGFF